MDNDGQTFVSLDSIVAIWSYSSGTTDYANALKQEMEAKMQREQKDVRRQDSESNAD